MSKIRILVTLYFKITYNFIYYSIIYFEKSDNCMSHISREVYFHMIIKIFFLLSVSFKIWNFITNNGY